MPEAQSSRAGRAWRWIENVFTTREIYYALAGLFGTSAGTATVAPSALARGPMVEKVAWIIAGGSLGGLVALGVTAVIHRGALKLPIVWRRYFGDPPHLQVDARTGYVAVLEIANNGGTTDLHAVGRIVDVKGAPMRRHDSYYMHWMNDWLNQPVVVQNIRVKKDSMVKLAVARFGLLEGAIPGTVWLTIMGNAEIADQYECNGYHEPSPVVTIEVTLKADPPLLVPFQRTYTVQIPKGERRVVIEEVKQ